MTTLIAMRGLPASGKSTYARAWVAEDPIRRARVNRDDCRAMLHDGAYHGRDTEKQIIAIRDAAVSALLKRGVSVVVDDTNLPSRTVRDVRRLATMAGAEFEIVDLTNVPLDVCLERNAARVGRALVPPDRVVEMHTKFVKGKPHPLPIVDEPDDSTGTAWYEPKPDAPNAVMVDIDGTVALMCARSPYDETRVHEDRPNLPVIEAVTAMSRAGHEVVFCSGRTEGCRAATAVWLRTHLAEVGVHAVLHMRQVGDMRKDSVVKAEIFDRHIRDRYNVVAVFDDRKQVVDMWRSIGLTVFQVAPGDF